MRRIFVVTEVPDDIDKFEAAASLAVSHPYMQDPTVYDSLEDLVKDMEEGQPHLSMYGKEGER